MRTEEMYVLDEVDYSRRFWSFWRTKRSLSPSAWRPKLYHRLYLFASPCTVIFVMIIFILET